MAYFHCLIGGGSSGGGYELTVTCDSAFAGTTITCTDGTTTLTQTCPSSSPYEVVFEIPNGGDWTISGTTGGHTVSTGVSIPTSAELIATIQQTVTIYSAKEDTISYVDIDGATQTITFASGESSKQVTIEIEASGSSITFTSGVAKDPSNLSNDYSKTVTITSNTTEVYIMPDGAIYWYGNEIVEMQAYPYRYGGYGTAVTPTVQKNTNNTSIYHYTANGRGIYSTKTKCPSGYTSAKIIVLSAQSTANGGTSIQLPTTLADNYQASLVLISDGAQSVGNTVKTITSQTLSDCYVAISLVNGVGGGTVSVVMQALWLE